MSQHHWEFFIAMKVNVAKGILKIHMVTVTFNLDLSTPKLKQIFSKAM